MSKDILRVVISDMHSGSNYALFLDHDWQGRHTSIIRPKSQQKKIREQFVKFTEQIKIARKDRTIELIHNGDAIDGDHHHSGDVCTLDTTEQANIHIELMQEFQKRIEWQAGDKLYYTIGTRIHTGEQENEIAKQLNAEMAGDFHSWEFLELNTFGVLSWFVHHGPAAGDGANEGNIMRNWLKKIYFDALKDERRPPDVVYSGHVHVPTYSTYIYRQKMNFKTMHGIITPSFQMKTKYALQKVPTNRNKIGGVMQIITKDGLIGNPFFSVVDTQA